MVIYGQWWYMVYLKIMWYDFFGQFYLHQSAIVTS